MYNNRRRSALRTTGGYFYLYEELSFLVNQIKAKASKVLRSHGKGLLTYLQCALLPTDYDNRDPEQRHLKVERSLFDSLEVYSFMEEEDCPPLWKLVILAELMDRTLVVNISGARSAQIPLHYSDNPNDCISQLWLDIYGLMAVMHNGFENFDQSTNGMLHKEDADDGTALHNRSGDNNSYLSRSPKTWPRYSDCESLESLILAADYYGFRLDFDFCQGD